MNLNHHCGHDGCDIVGNHYHDDRGVAIADDADEPTISLGNTFDSNLFNELPNAAREGFNDTLSLRLSIEQ